MPTTFDAGELPADYFAGGSGLPTGELARILNKLGDDLAELSTATRERVAGPIRMALDGTLVYRYQHLGEPAELSEVASVISGALAVGDATITLTLNGDPVSPGVITITQSGSAAGDQDSIAPALELVAGDVVEFTVGGTNTATEFADVTLLLTY